MEPGFPREMIDSRLVAEKKIYNLSMEYLVVSENKEVLKKKMKGTRANLKELPVVKSEAI